jgi:hypothetical protein
MLDPVGPEAVTAAPVPALASPRNSAFHELLSELNPLQYLPVVGTIYRAITGDVIPDTARTIGALVVSGLMGGPVGVALNVAGLAVEKATGIDPEKIGKTVLADLGIGDSPRHAPGPAPVATVPLVAEVAAAPAPAAPAPKAWSAAQLKSYGVTATADGTLQRGDERGADVLNGLELARLQAGQPDAKQT